jgi:hypothetical protein
VFCKSDNIKRLDKAMPIPGLVSGAIMASSSSKTPQMAQIAQGVELGLYQWLLASTVQGVATGAVGSGGCVGSMVVVPNAPLMEGAFKSNGLVGVFAPVMWTPIMLGISQPYFFAGAVAGVGVGSFIGGIVGDPILLTQLLVGSFTSVGILGVDRVRICTALGQGISSHFLTTVANGVVAGAPGPAPSSSPFVGNFL